MKDLKIFNCVECKYGRTNSCFDPEKDERVEGHCPCGGDLLKRCSLWWNERIIIIRLKNNNAEFGTSKIILKSDEVLSTEVISGGD